MDNDFESELEFDEFCKLFDEQDQDLFEKVRFKLGKDFQKGWGHNSIYNVTEFKNGTLEALEKTRRDLSCKSAEYLIDILYTLGYADKRIMYIIWKLGYYNISFRDYRKYKRDNKIKLKRLQDDYLQKMSDKKLQLFQDRQQDVLEVENRTLSLYLERIRLIQDELDADPTMFIDEGTKFNRYVKTMENLQAKIDEMHAITKKRDASVKIQQELAIAEGLAKQKVGQETNTDAPQIAGNTTLIE